MIWNRNKWRIPSYALILCVNDILLTTNDFGLLSETKKFISNKFEMKDMSETYYVI